MWALGFLEGTEEFGIRNLRPPQTMLCDSAGNLIEIVRWP